MKKFLFILIALLAFNASNTTINAEVKATREGKVFIQNAHHSSTGVVMSNLYIVPLIRCSEVVSSGLDNTSYHRCLQLFAEDVKKYDFRDILLLGEAARRFLSVEVLKPHLNKLFISQNKRRYVVNYSPFIKYTGEYHYDMFKDNFIKWFNFTIEHDYSQYDIKMI